MVNSKNIKKLIIKKGYITVEAAIVIPFFISIMISLMFLVNVLYVEQVIQNALYESTKQFSMDSYLYKKLGVYEVESETKEKLREKLNFFESFTNINVIDEQELSEEIVTRIHNKAFMKVYKLYFKSFLDENNHSPEQLGIVGGYDGLNFSKSLILEGNTYINITYELKNIVPIKVIPNLKVSQGVYIKNLGNGVSIVGNIAKEIIELDYDIWLEENFDRGRGIEILLGNNLGNQFYGLDKVENGTLISIVSVDVRTKSYSNNNSLYKRVKAKIDELDEFTEGSKQGITVLRDDYTDKLVNIVIPRDKLEEKHQKQIDDLVRYARSKDIKLKITVIKTKS